MTIPIVAGFKQLIWLCQSTLLLSCMSSSVISRYHRPVSERPLRKL